MRMRSTWSAKGRLREKRAERSALNRASARMFRFIPPRFESFSRLISRFGDTLINKMPLKFTSKMLSGMVHGFADIASFSVSRHARARGKPILLIDLNITPPI